MPANPRRRNNNVMGTITDNPLTNVATTMNSAGLANLEAIATEHAVLTLDPLRTAGAPEYVIVTAHTGSATSATITRGAYGSAARQHASGTVWVHAPLIDDYIALETSATRPSDPYRGQLIYESDTDSYVGRTQGDVWQTVVPLGAWTSYTPTLTQSGSVTNTVSYAKYVRLGRTIIANVFLTVTGTGTGGAAVIVSVPVAASISGYTAGTGKIYDSSATVAYNGTAELVSTTTVRFWPASADSTNVLGVTVFTAALASSDQVHMHVIYEAAS
jgi:hypothetical protein